MTNHTFVEFAKLIRLKSLGMSMIPVIGALSTSSDLFLGDFFILFSVGVLINAVGFMLNDLVDLNKDKVSPDFKNRPMVQLILSPRLVKKLIIFFFLIVVLTVILYFQNIFALIALLIGSGFGILYDLFGKKIYSSDLFLASAFASFYFFGTLTQSNDFSSFNIIFILLIFFQVLYFNMIEGGLKDVCNDYKTGAKTIASKMGVKTKPKIIVPNNFKFIAIFLDSIIICLIISPFLFIQTIYEFGYWFIPLVFLLLVIVNSNYTMFRMLYMKKFQRDVLQKIIGIQELSRFFIYLGLLVLLTKSFLWSVFLILIPILWALIWMLIFKLIFHQSLPRTSKLL